MERRRQRYSFKRNGNEKRIKSQVSSRKSKKRTGKIIKITIRIRIDENKSQRNVFEWF